MPRKRRGKDPEPDQPGNDDAKPQEEQPQPEGPQVPCAHGSHDGQACAALNCHVADVPARIEELLRRKKAADDATLAFSAKLKGATMNADGELTIALIANVADPWALHHKTFVLKGRSVAVTLLVEPERASSDASLPGQQGLPFEGATAPEPVDMIVCSTCHRIARGEGEEPGRICGFCAEGELIITSVIPLVCSNCKQPQELASAKAGDTCTLCKEGRYLQMVGAEPVVNACGDLVRFIEPGRVAEISDAVCGLEIQNDHIAKALVTVGTDQFAVTEIASSDPITFEAWRAVPMDEFGGEYHEDGTKLDGLRVTLGADGAAFVLQGPPLRLIVQPEEAEPGEEAGPEEAPPAEESGESE